jgi:hypothetical protein
MDVTDIRQFFIASLATDPNLSDLDTSPDSNFDDLVVKPHVLFSKAIFDEIAAYKQTISLNDRSVMTSAQLDAVASKFFVQRRTSSTLALEVTIYLSLLNNNVLSIYTTDFFRTSDSISFNPVQNYVFVPSVLPTVIINGQTLRVATITVVSNNATRKINVNEITSYTINHPSLINVTNLRASTPPVLPETNEELNIKIDNSLFTRNLINRPAIYNAISDAFPQQLVTCYSVGFGDPEMQRDIVPAGQQWSFHVGGTIDIYVRTSLKPVTLTAVANRVSGNNYSIILKRYKGYDVAGTDNSNPSPELLFGWQLIELPDPTMTSLSVLPELPFMYTDLVSNTFRVGTLDKNSLAIDSDTHEYKIEVIPLNSPHLRFSIYEHIQIILHMTQDAGDYPTVILPYFTMDSLESIQQYVQNPQSIFHCADTVVKSFIPVEIRDFTIKYDNKYSVDVTGLTILLANIINNWNSPEHIRLSTLLSNVPVPVRIGQVGDDFTVDAGLFGPDGYITVPPSQMNQNQYNKLPTYIEVVQHNIDNSIYHFVSTDQLCSIEIPKLSATRRTVKYFIQPENIHFIPTSW